MVNPGIPIPSEVTALTGINNDDVENAPMIDDVLDAIAEFIGDGVIVGHNIQFDINFLSRYRIAHRNQFIDTYELASVLIPNAPRYNLTSLTDQLQIGLENAHDALADAIAAAHLYWKLWQKLNNLPFDTIQEIVTLIGNIEWGASVAFQSAYELRMESDAPEPEMPRVASPFEVSDEDWSYLRPKADIESIDPDSVAEIIEPEGLLSKFIDGYESRPSQVEMLREVTESLNQHQHLMVEAPTGTGKSIAYTLPSISWALKNRERRVRKSGAAASSKKPSSYYFAQNPFYYGNKLGVGVKYTTSFTSFPAPRFNTSAAILCVPRTIVT